MHEGNGIVQKFGEFLNTGTEMTKIPVQCTSQCRAYESQVINGVLAHISLSGARRIIDPFCVCFQSPEFTVGLFFMIVYFTIYPYNSILLFIFII